MRTTGPTVPLEIISVVVNMLEEQEFSPVVKIVRLFMTCMNMKKIIGGQFRIRVTVNVYHGGENVLERKIIIVFLSHKE